jgi:hypothetical protein
VIALDIVCDEAGWHPVEDAVDDTARIWSAIGEVAEIDDMLLALGRGGVLCDRCVQDVEETGAAMDISDCIDACVVRYTNRSLLETSSGPVAMCVLMSLERVAQIIEATLPFSTIWAVGWARGEYRTRLERRPSEGLCRLDQSP